MTRESVNRGRQLRLVREYRGFTQSQLTNQINGLSQSNLSKFEKGFEGAIGEDKLRSIMTFLNWPISWLSVRHPNHFNL